MQLVNAETGEVAGEGQGQELALLDGHFKFLPTGLVVIGEPTLEECSEAARYIHFIGKMAPIWLGDLLNWMECKWGEGYAQVLDSTGFAYQTVVNAKSVMGRVPHEVRQDDLTFTHYSQVASLPSPQQERLLQQAKQQELNTSEFKRVVRREKRQTRLGNLPQMVKMEASLVFSVPADLKDKLRFTVEGMANRLEEWDIECEFLDVREL
jgi:hypothetical protein